MAIERLAPVLWLPTNILHLMLTVQRPGYGAPMVDEG